jgi:hypothetical protein
VTEERISAVGLGGKVLELVRLFLSGGREEDIFTRRNGWIGGVSVAQAQLVLEMLCVVDGILRVVLGGGGEKVVDSCG